MDKQLRQPVNSVNLRSRYAALEKEIVRDEHEGSGVRRERRENRRRFSPFSLFSFARPVDCYLLFTNRQIECRRASNGRRTVSRYLGFLPFLNCPTNRSRQRR